MPVYLFQNGLLTKIRLTYWVCSSLLCALWRQWPVFHFRVRRSRILSQIWPEQCTFPVSENTECMVSELWNWLLTSSEENSKKLKNAETTNPSRRIDFRLYCALSLQIPFSFCCCCLLRDHSLDFVHIWKKRVICEKIFQRFKRIFNIVCKV